MHEDGKAVNGNPGYEKRDTNVRLLMTYGLILFVIVVVSFVLMHIMFHVIDSDLRASSPPVTPLHEADPRPPSPRLRVDGTADYLAIREEETRQLNSYGWTDKANGIAHVPVERAIEMIAESGMPDWSEAEGGESP